MFKWRERIDSRTVFYFLVAVLATVPAWIVRHPPLQDIPVHLAALRVVHSYSDPAFGFESNYYLNLTHTQYTLYYVMGTLLAYVLGVTKANVAMVCIYLGGTPLALRSLLRELGKDERLCLFSLPLLVNALFMLGLLPFLLGIPFLFLSLAAGIRYVRAPTRKNGIWLAVLSCLLFFAHVFPFAVFGLGFAAMFPWGKPRTWIKSGLPVVPALLLVVWWVAFSPAGGDSWRALFDADHGGVDPLDRALPGVFQWTINIFRDATDEKWAIALAVVAAISVGLSQGDPDRSLRESRPFALLPIVCMLCYFTMGDKLGDNWLVGKRFPVIALFAAIPLLRIPTGARGLFVVMALLGVDACAIANTCEHFIAFEQKEVGDFDGAIEAMDPGKKVAGLIYDSSSSILNNVPFLHFVSYYQAEKGGIVQFSYAHFNHWPFRYREGKYPPPGGPARLRWEWTPQSVTMDELYPYYDYVLTRGNGFHPPPDKFHVKWHGDAWTVWARN